MTTIIFSSDDVVEALGSYFHDRLRIAFGQNDVELQFAPQQVKVGGLKDVCFVVTEKQS